MFPVIIQTPIAFELFSSISVKYTLHSTDSHMFS